MTDLHSINAEQRLYVLNCGKGYSCLGFDVAERWRAGYLKWLNMPCEPVEIGTEDAYNAYCAASVLVAEYSRRTGEKCPTQLTPQLVGLEGKRVEVTTPSGEKSRFWVGKSTGWVPIHLEIKTRRSYGGAAAYVPTGSTVRVVANHK